MHKKLVIKDEDVEDLNQYSGFNLVCMQKSKNNTIFVFSERGHDNLNDDGQLSMNFFIEVNNE